MIKEIETTNNNTNVMFVLKRDGRQEPVHFDKITSRIKKLSYNLSVKPELVAQKTISGMYDGVKTTELDTLAAETSAHLVLSHPDYGILASRIEVSNLHKETSKSFSETMYLLYDNGVLQNYFIEKVNKYKNELDSAIIHDRDFEYDYFGFKTLERSYLLKTRNRIVERPQMLLMRVAVAIHSTIEDILTSYDMMSRKFFTPATPTLYNAGTVSGALSSCYLGCIEDSIEEIYQAVNQCAVISKYCGGIGMSVTPVRSAGSTVKGTNGRSAGIIPFAKVFNETARSCDQGGRRKGSIVLFLETFHPDLLEFIELRKNHGAEELRARDLFLGLWVNDLFMKRVERNENWSFFDPHECFDLIDLYGDEFEKRYEHYEQMGVARKVMNARDIMKKIVEAQIETGTPYMCYKDASNKKTNYQNRGTIRNSNLCVEISQYSRKDEISSCNLATVSLPSCIFNDSFDFEKLREIVHHMTLHLNRVIDNTNQVLPEIVKGNRERPIGIGVQGLQDVFFQLKLPFESENAKQLNKDIFETIYYAALEKSVELSKIDGFYHSFEGSPVSKGILQFDMWNVKPSDRYNWNDLKEKIREFGVRNCVLIAPPPTASTSQILGNVEAFEAITSNIFTRRTLSGEFVLINKYLIKDLIKLGLWNENMKNELMRSHGSVQGLNIPQELKDIYRDVWEISQKSVIDMATDRGAFIDQSQSMNIHIANPTVSKVMSMHFYGWKKGLKTGMYYLRSKAATDAIQFTVSTSAVSEKEKLMCSLQNKEECEMCSS